MTRRFAQDTSVPVGQSQSEVKDRLRKAGASAIAVYEDEKQTVVAFVVAGRQYRMTVPIPEKGNRAQEERRAWRLLLLLLKAKTEAIREGATTVEREFFADAVLYDGRTMHETYEPQLQLAQARGHMPPPLMLEGPR